MDGLEWKTLKTLLKLDDLGKTHYFRKHPIGISKSLGCCLSMMVEKNLGNISQVDRHVWFLTGVGETIT